jgi:hypothetical protein
MCVVLFRVVGTVVGTAGFFADQCGLDHDARYLQLIGQVECFLPGVVGFPRTWDRHIGGSLCELFDPVSGAQQTLPVAGDAAAFLHRLFQFLRYPERVGGAAALQWRHGLAHRL